MFQRQVKDLKKILKLPICYILAIVTLLKKELVKENSLIAGTVGQSTETMGQEAAAVALKIMNEEKFDKTTYIDTFMINKDNVKEYGVDKWQ